MSLISVPNDVFRDENDLRWIQCKNWATGGSASGIENTGSLNNPLYDLLGNDKWLRVRLVDLVDLFTDHLTDPNAHVTVIDARIDVKLDAWAIPAAKIKASLSEAAGITDDDVETAAAISESKLSLELVGLQRPLVAQSLANTYADTGDLAADLYALHQKLSGFANAFNAGEYLGKSLNLTGWIIPVKSMYEESLGAFKISGNRIVFAHSEETLNEAHLFVQGVPLFFDKVLSDIDPSDDLSGNKDTKCQILDLGVEADLFKSLSSSIMFDASKTTRQDMVYLEVWKEDIPENSGFLFSNGNVLINNRDQGYEGIRYSHSDQGITTVDAGIGDFIQESRNLVLVGSEASFYQLRNRVCLVEDKNALSECTPQGPLSVTAETAATLEYALEAVEADSRLKLSSSTAELYTGNVIQLVLNSGVLPGTLSENTDYFVIRPSGGNADQIQLAATKENCFAGNEIAVPVTASIDLTAVLSLSTYADITVTDETVTDLFNTYVLTGSDEIRIGTPVRIEYHVSDLTTKLPDFYEGASYYVKTVSPGFIALYRHETPFNETTPLVQVGFTTGVPDEDLQGLIRLTDPDNDEITEDFKISNHVLDPKAQYLRSNTQWREYHKVSVEVVSVKSYIHTEETELTEDETYFLFPVFDSEEGNYVGSRLARTYKDALAQKPLTYVDSRLAGDFTLKHYAGFHPGLNRGYHTAKVAVGEAAELTEVMAIPFFKIHRRNAGVFDPKYNPNGTALLASGGSLSSTEDCFDPDNIASYDPDQNLLGVWADAVADTLETVDTAADIGADPSNTIAVDKEWQDGVKIRFVLQSGDLPDGIEEGTDYWVYNRQGAGPYTIQIVPAEDSETPVSLTPASSGTMDIEATAENYRAVGEGVFFRTGYSCFLEKGKTPNEAFKGISGRPDGLFYDVCDPADIIDLRHRVLTDPDFDQILSDNLDVLFRGALFSEEKTLLLSDNTESDIVGVSLLQVDRLHTGESEVGPTLAKDVNRRRTAEFGGNVVFSYDHLDGLRRIWSDATVVQKETDIVVFGDSLQELPAAFLDLSLTTDVMDVRQANFSHSEKLGDSVSPKQLLDVDYSVWKYRSLEGGGSNKLALSGVKLARGGRASGDFEGAMYDDNLRMVRFEPDTELSPYRVQDIHDEQVGLVTQRLKSDLTVNAVYVRNEGRSVDIEINPFRIPKPLRSDIVYRIFADEDGYYKIATSLGPASTQETLDFIIDGDSVYASNDSGIMIEPLFSQRREPVRRHQTLLLDESYLAIRDVVETGSEIRFSFPNDYSGSDIDYELPPALQGHSRVFYAIADGKVEIEDELFHRVRLADTRNNATLGNYISFVDQFQDDEGDEGDLFFADIETNREKIRVTFEYPDQLLPFDSDTFDHLVTGAPVQLRPSGSDRLPKPFDPDLTYHASIGDGILRLAASVEDLKNGVFVSLLERKTAVVDIIPTVAADAVSLPVSPILLRGSDAVWKTGTKIRFVDPDGSGLQKLDGNGDPVSLGDEASDTYYVVAIDSQRFRLAASTLKDAYDRTYLSLTAPAAQQVTAVPKSIGMVGTVKDVEGTKKILLPEGFNLAIGYKTEVMESPFAEDPDVNISADFHELPSTLAAGTSYYLSPTQIDGDVYVDLALTYQDARNNALSLGSPTLVSLSSATVDTKIQFVGYPAKMAAADVLGQILILGADLEEGTPVELDYFADAPAFYGRTFPTGLSLNRTYHTDAIADNKVHLFDTLKDVILDDLASGGDQEPNPIVLRNPFETDLYFKIIPTAAFESVSFYSDKRLTELNVPRGTWKTGTPVRLKATGFSNAFPIVSGIRENETLFLVRRSEEEVSFVRSFEEAYESDQTDYVEFINDQTVVDPTAYVEFIPQPVDSIGDPVETHNFNADSVSVDGRVRLNRIWLSGTPVYFDPMPSGALGPDIQLNETYYTAIHRIWDEDAPDVELGFTSSLEAAYVYEQQVSISDVGKGSMKVIPLNRAEIVYTAGERIVITDLFHNSWLRNTIQTQQEWVTATPIRFQNVGEGRLPQYYEFADQPTTVGDNLDLPVLEVDADLDRISDSTKSYYSAWNGVLTTGEALLVSAIGNDIPGGLNEDAVYFVAGISKTLIGETTETRLKLASSFHAALLGQGVDIKSVVKDGYLSVTSWKRPDGEIINLGSGYLDLSENTIQTQNYWPTGIPVTVSPASGSSLPDGLSSDRIYFTDSFGPNKIRLMTSLADFYQSKLGQYLQPENENPVTSSGTATFEVTDDPPRIEALTDDTVNSIDGEFVSQYDSSIDGGETLRIWVGRSGEIPADNTTRIDLIRFGNIDVSPPGGASHFSYTDAGDHRYIEVEVPAYPQDALVEVMVRKKTAEGDYLWSQPIPFIYLSSAFPVLFRVTPNTVFADWRSTEYEETYWGAFEGKITLLCYLPKEFLVFNNVAIQLDHLAIGNTKPLSSSLATEYVTEYTVSSDVIPDRFGNRTPFWTITFDYVPPTIEHVDNVVTDEVLSLITDVSFVSNDVARTPLSLNSITLNNMSHVDSENTPFLLMTGAPKMADSPGILGSPEADPDIARDFVFGYDDTEAYIRVIAPGYSKADTILTFEDPITGEKESVTAYASLESWDGDQQLIALYVSVPKRFSNLWTVKLYLADNPDLVLDFSYLDGTSPFVGHSGAVETEGGVEFVFTGSNLETVDTIFIRNEALEESDPDYERRQPVQILRQSENELAVVIPPFIYDDGEDTRHVTVELNSSTRGMALMDLVYDGNPASRPAPRVEVMLPDFFFGKIYDDSGTDRVKLDTGVLVSLSGNHLESVTKVTLDLVSGLIDGEADVTYEVTNISRSTNRIWFNLPAILKVGIQAGSIHDAVFDVWVEDQFGQSSWDPDGQTGTKTSLKLKGDANYDAIPSIIEITPDSGNNSEQFMVIIRGYNLADATSVRFGSQYLNEGQFVIGQGVSAGADTITFYSEPVSDKGPIQVVVTTNFGGSLYLQSAPAYFSMRNLHYAQLLSSGVGEIEISPRNWDLETVSDAEVSSYDSVTDPYGASLVEVTQRIPSGTPVRLKAQSPGVLPSGLSEDKIYYAVATDLRKIKLRGAASNNLVSLSVPSEVTLEIIPLNSEDLAVSTTVVKGDDSPLPDWTNWANGQEVFFIFGGTGTPPGGIEEGKRYWIGSLDATAESNRGTFKLYTDPSLDAEYLVDNIADSPGGEGFSINMAVPQGNFITLVHLPKIPDPQNPTNEIVDWDFGIARFTEQIPLNNFHIDGPNSSIIVRSGFWDSSKTVGLNPYYPPFFGDEAEPVPNETRTAFRLPTGSDQFARKDWDAGFVLGVDEELEYVVDTTQDVKYLIGLSTTFINSVSPAPSLIELEEGNLGFTLEIVDDYGFELFPEERINASTDSLVTLKDTDAGEWRNGMPVVLGSQLPTPLVEGGIYYNTGDPSRIVLSVEDPDAETDTEADLQDDGYGFIRLTTTYKELSPKQTFYVEDAENGRIRVYKTLADLLNGNFIRFMESNETEMLIRPITASNVLDLDSSRFTLESDEVLDGDENLVTGTPIKLQPYDEDSVLPEGLEADRIYHVYRTGDSVYRLYEGWRKVALLDSHVIKLERSSNSVTMNPDFTGERVLQSMDAPELDGDHVDLENSRIHLKLTNSHSNPDGTPVRFVSDKPVLSKADMLTESRSLEIFFKLRYGQGTGLTDRMIQPRFETGQTVSRGVKTVEDNYMVKDPRYACVSTGGASYWDQAFDLQEEKTIPTEFFTAFVDTNKLAVDRWDAASQGFYRALKLMDGFLPGAFSPEEIPLDDTTLVEGVENAFMNYDGGNTYVLKYDDFLPPNLKRTDIYFAFLCYRLDSFDDATGQRLTEYVNLPVSSDKGTVKAADDTASAITITWDRENRTVTFEGIGTDDSLSFRLGFCSVDYENNSDIPPYDASTFDGSYEVGSVWESNPQCRQIELSAMKKLLRTKTLDNDGFGWTPNGGYPDDPYAPAALIPESARGFRDSCGFAWTAWTEADGGGDPPTLFEPVFIHPTDAFFEGEGDLYVDEFTNSVELLYFSGFPENPSEIYPVKNSDGSVNIFYRRNPPKFSFNSENKKILGNPNFLLSSAGSGNFRTDDQKQAFLNYPFLLFGLITPKPLYTYKISAMISDDQDRLISSDPSCVQLPLLRIEQVFDGGIRPQVSPLSTSRKTISDVTRTMPRLSSDETKVLITPLWNNASPRTLVPVEVKGSEHLSLLPNLLVDENEVHGVLLLEDGESALELVFPLPDHPLVRVRP